MSGPILLADPTKRSGDMEFFYNEDDAAPGENRRLDENDWFEVQLPVGLLLSRLIDFPDYDDPYEARRMKRIQTWAEEFPGGLAEALNVSPLIIRHAPGERLYGISFELIDGFHRAAEARDRKLTHVTVLVGFPKGCYTAEDVDKYHEEP